jgi:hypothetical protein
LPASVKNGLLRTNKDKKTKRSISDTEKTAFATVGAILKSHPEKQKSQSEDWLNCLMLHCYYESGPPGPTRTAYPLVRSQVLYPDELRAVFCCAESTRGEAEPCLMFLIADQR